MDRTTGKPKLSGMGGLQPSLRPVAGRPIPTGPRMQKQMRQVLEMAKEFGLSGNQQAAWIEYVAIDAKLATLRPEELGRDLTIVIEQARAGQCSTVFALGKMRVDFTVLGLTGRDVADIILGRTDLGERETVPLRQNAGAIAPPLAPQLMDESEATAPLTLEDDLLGGWQAQLRNIPIPGTYFNKPLIDSIIRVLAGYERLALVIETFCAGCADQGKINERWLKTLSTVRAEMAGKLKTRFEDKLFALLRDNAQLLDRLLGYWR